MSIFSKLRVGNGAELPSRNAPRAKANSAAALAVAEVGTSAVSGTVARTGRLSNGLKEFLWQLEGIGRGHLLDLGPARQTTITFFIERGYKVYTDDLLMTWKIFLDDEALRLKKLPADADRSEFTPEGRAKKFLETTML